MRHLIAIAWVLFCLGCQSTERQELPKKEPSASNAKGAGSCVRTDATNSALTTCQELSGATDAESLCKVTGGKWFAASCNPKAYAKKCVSKIKESVDDGPQHDVQQTDYFAEGSEMTCLGEEAGIDQKTGTADKKPTNSVDQIMDLADVEAELSDLPTPNLTVGAEITWGGTLEPGKAFAAPEFAIPFETTADLYIKVLTLQTTEECMESVAMALSYEFEEESGSGEFGTHMIFGGILQPVDMDFPVVSGSSETQTGTLKVRGKVEPEDALDRRCPFLTSFRVQERSN